MAYDLLPNRFLSFPHIQFPSIWDDNDDWLSMPSTPTGLSVSEDDKNIYIEASLPGIDPKNIDVTFQEGYLWVKGEAKDEEKDSNRKYYRQAARSFSYRVAVPGEVDTTAEPQATYKHGVMKVAFAKSPKTQPKKIQVKSEDEK